MDTTRTRTAPAAGQEAAVACPVADVMRRVHEQLRGGVAPSFEALLAFGEPRQRDASVPGAALAR